MRRFIILMIILIGFKGTLFSGVLDDYSQACTEGDVSSCYQLAIACRDGDGVRVNAVAARQFLEIACDKGNTQACEKLKTKNDREFSKQNSANVASDTVHKRSDSNKMVQASKSSSDKNFIYDGSVDIQQAIDHGDIKTAQKKIVFWNEISRIAELKGDVSVGEGSFAMCEGCHMEGAANMVGATPPSLEYAGTIYDKKFLIALIKDPAIATNVDHKYPNGTMAHPMGSVMVMFPNEQQIADVVAYILKEKTKSKIRSG